MEMTLSTTTTVRPPRYAAPRQAFLLDPVPYGTLWGRCVAEGWVRLPTVPLPVRPSMPYGTLINGYIIPLLVAVIVVCNVLVCVVLIRRRDLCHHGHAHFGSCLSFKALYFMRR